MESLKALEDISGAAFQAAVAREDTLWSKGLHEIPASTLKGWGADISTYQRRAWPMQRSLAHVHFEWNGEKVSLQHGAAGYTQNVWIGPTWFKEGLSGIGFSRSSLFYTLEDIGSGSEQLELTLWSWTSNKPRKLWQRAPVGPAVAIHGDRVFFSTVENMLRYPDICSVYAENGKAFHRHYRQPDKRVQVTLLDRGDHLFVHEANALNQRIGILDTRSGKLEQLRWITGVLKTTLIPVAPDIYATDRAFVVGSRSHRESWPLPPEHHIEDAAILDRRLFAVTVKDGAAHLWVLSHDHWICLWKPSEGLGEVQIQHEPTAVPTFLLRSPSVADRVVEFRVQRRVEKEGEEDVGKLHTVLEYPTPLRLHTVATGQAGKAGVPWHVVSHVAKPRKLLVEAYGAYGISSRRAYPVRWLAYLARGYAIAYVCPRGGREKGDAWWDGGRTAVHKHNTFADAAAAIEAIQRRLRVGAENTVFFGRSAGGWLAAAVAQQYGHLIAAVYAEVPYVDVLTTTSNPALPLTQLEYDEFGDPVRRPAEKKALEKISPVDTVPVGGPGAPRVVVRTGLHDAQVFPYEALKWAARLREQGWGQVFVGIDHGGGHFATAAAMVDQRAEDAALLDQVVKAASVERRKTAKRSRPVAARRSGTVKRTRRRRTASRKQATKQATSTAAL